MAEETEARLLITERIWSRTAERFFRRIGNLLSGVRRIPEEKTVLRKWIKSKVPLYKENWTFKCEFSVASLWLFFANYYSLRIPYVPKTVAVFKLFLMCKISFSRIFPIL